jgi:hypothetical protein
MGKRRFTGAESMNKSKTCQELMSLPPSEPDVVSPCSTQIDKASLDSGLPNGKHTVIVLLSIIDSMSFEFLSGDAWYLALSRCSMQCQELGIPKETVKKVIESVLERRKKRSSQNPINGMF